MKIKYTGRQVELAPAQAKKLEAQFSKIGKLLDGRRECEAHVILSVERHLHRAEATVHYYNHQLVGLGSSTDLFTAINSAAEKLEKQALRTREKWRDNKRTPPVAVEEPEPAPAAPVAKKVRGKRVEPKKMAQLPQEEQRVYHVDEHKKRKPMTVEEAVMDLDKTRDYVVYRDAETGRTQVLIRRRDGHFDLVEA